MRAAKVVQQLCKSRGTCFKFYCRFYFTCDRSLIVRIATTGGLTEVALYKCFY